MARLILTIVSLALAGACTRQSTRDDVPTAPTPGGGSAACSVTFTLATTTFDHTVGQTTMTISASSPSCPWEVIRTQPWLIVSPATSGTGSAQLTLTLTAWGGTRQVDVSLGSASATILQRPTAPMSVHVNCRQGRAATIVVGACTASVLANEFDPRSTGIEVSSDLRRFGLSETYRWLYVIATGGTEWDLDLRIPADFPPGPVEIPVRVVDQQGRELRVTGIFTVLPASTN